MDDIDQVKRFYKSLRNPDAEQMLIGELRKLAGYGARKEIEGICASLSDHRRLEHYGQKFYSQNDEDGILARIFKRLDIETGMFIEIGVGSGLECNSLFLLHQGWHGVWIDQSKESAAFIKQRFASALTGAQPSLFFAQAQITPENINKYVVGEPEFVSIDIDGLDFYVLQAMKARPLVVCIEYNAKWPPPIRRVIKYDPTFAWRGTDYFGASLCSLCDVAKELGYTLVGTNITGVNAFFVRSDQKFTNFAAPGDPERLYNPPRYWLTYDAFQRCGHHADFGEYA